jgi:hypothetical protein
MYGLTNVRVDELRVDECKGRRNDVELYVGHGQNKMLIKKTDRKISQLISFKQ